MGTALLEFGKIREIREIVEIGIVEIREIRKVEELAQPVKNRFCSALAVLGDMFTHRAYPIRYRFQRRDLILRRFRR